jgi:hypothetical protein
MTKFHHEHHVNQLILEEDWRQVYDNETYTANEILALIVGYYELDDHIAEALCLQYDTDDRAQGERRTIMMRAQETLPDIIIRTNDEMEQRLTIDDVNLSCFYSQGSLIKEDLLVIPNSCLKPC